MDETVDLKAGELSAQFVKGELRSVRLGDCELLNRVYFALRDANWETIPQRVSGVKTQVEEGAFQISFDCCSEGAEIDFRWKCAISGEKDRVVFSIEGRAYSDFSKNRNGFCVLHPLDCKDKQLVVTHSDGSKTSGMFPKYISPHQPFKDIVAMDWSVEGASLHLDLSGDVFEMEDQRNWTDASFKTYCTLLEHPFPVGVRRGDEVHQRIELRVVDLIKERKRGSAISNRLKILDTKTSLPSLGLEANEESLDKETLSRLTDLNLSYLRVEARTHEDGWRTVFERSMRQAKQLNLPVELVVFLERADLQCIDFLAEELEDAISIKSILPVDLGSKSTPMAFLSLVKEKFQNSFPGVPIGGGTNCYFAELNRFRPPFEYIDFVSFSVNPQVHSFEDRFLVETNQTLTDIVDSTRVMAGSLPIHLSPVTLKPRFNPDATEENGLEEQRRKRLDGRHVSTFNSLWIVGCFKQFAQSQVQSITYFQTVGEEGVMMPDRASAFDGFPAKARESFPVFEVLEILGNFKGGRIRHTHSFDPMVFEGVILEKEKRRDLLLVNYADDPISVEVSGDSYRLEPISFSRFQLQ